MKQFNMMDFVQQLVALSPRQLEGETRTSLFLQSFLEKHSVPFVTESFHVDIPHIKKATLKLDGVSVPCAGASMIGGTISSQYKLLSSLITSRVLQDEPNITFNPRCSGISKSNYYFAPALAVDHEVLQKILKATKVRGEVVVEKKSQESVDILVGNKKNPRIVCFAHYDSIETGAIDNASGVATMMAVVLEKPELLKEVLFVFSANEELSYDRPVYWGHGFRMFEKRHTPLLSKAKKIVVIDSVGNGKTGKITEVKDIMLGFPLANIQKWHKKIAFLSGDFDHLMTVYHSALDDGRGMSLKWLKDAKRMLEVELG